jgi:hypothetical protein
MLRSVNRHRLSRISVSDNSRRKPPGSFCKTFQWPLQRHIGELIEKQSSSDVGAPSEVRNPHMTGGDKASDDKWREFRQMDSEKPPVAVGG